MKTWDARVKRYAPKSTEKYRGYPTPGHAGLDLSNMSFIIDSDGHLLVSQSGSLWDHPTASQLGLAFHLLKGRP